MTTVVPSRLTCSLILEAMSFTFCWQSLPQSVPVAGGCLNTLGIWSMNGFRHGYTESGNVLKCYVKAVLLLQLSAKEVPEHLVVAK